MALADCLRVYDQMMSDFAGGFSTQDQSVLTVFATPDRPFAEVIQEAIKADEEFRSQMMESNLIASVTRLDPVYNPKLRVDVPFGPILTTPLNNAGDLAYSEYPRPYLMPYQLDLRSRSRTAANLWAQWFYFKFNPYVCFNVDFGVLWGTKQIQTELSSVRHNSDLETAEKERWIRWTVKINVLNAWMFPITDNTADIPDPFGMLYVEKIVKKVFFQVYLSPNNPPVPDPTIPGVQLVDTVERAELQSAGSVAVESN